MNTHRLTAVDFVRGFSVLIMVCVHTLWMYGSSYTQGQSLLGEIIHLLGKGTAAFLIAMGISLLLSRYHSPRALAKRGVTILALGYGMNALKFVLPIALGVLPESFINAYGWQSPLQLPHYLYLLGTGDILQMAGLSLLLLSLVVHPKRSPWLYIALALLVAFVTPLIRGWQSGMTGLDYLSDLFVGAQFNVYFPVFPWLACVLFGLALSARLRQGRPLARSALHLGLPLLIVGGALCLWDKDTHFNDFFHLGPGGALYLSGLNLVALAAIDKLLHLSQNGPVQQRVMTVLTYCSRHVTSLYITQWVLVCWGMAWVGFKTLTPWQCAAMMPVMLLLTFAIQRLLFVRQRQPATTQPHTHKVID
ncbi:hypothetical protein CWC31_12290 [Pseudoalteromonas ruthenica]|uniref:heparan-alpha-glucosaminide N-acetyltransferase domain-containing protein n=1 Tax=Pseudoalteromonas ruthenica TaxID=151081 RepID=UPI001108E146|nr:heparan-alpha-glucosaminide N-acetyltransferase domain-containing protein [Pseudoalteromonas ruthenica]TLX50423.1 hypothetical protein CWC31_12290 [Pseudoalteromonas ruthenica]